MAIGDKLWLVGEPEGTQLISAIDGLIEDNNYAVQRMLKHLIVGCNVYNSSSTEITIKAGSVACTDGTTYKFRENTSAVTDSDGSMDADSWYDVLAVADASATTFTAEINKNGTAAAGTHVKRISMFKTDGSGNIIDFVHDGNTYQYKTSQTIKSGNLGTGSWTSVDTSGYIPSTLSTHTFGTVFHSSGGHIANDSSVNVTTDDDNRYTIFASNTMHWELPILTANTLYAASDNAGFKMRINGYYVNQGTYMR